MIIRAHRKLLFYSSLIFLMCLNGCYPRWSKIISSYVASESPRYNLKTIMIIPLEKDDTTYTGTLYSTNHFLNELKLHYPSYNFDVLDIKDILQSDPLVVKSIIQSLKKNKKLDNNLLNNSALADSLNKRNADALIVGELDDHDNKIHFWIGNMQLKCTWVTESVFSYYLVALKDGVLLWNTTTLGEAEYDENVFNFGNSPWQLYPPVDAAISNGIDLFIHDIPLKK